MMVVETSADSLTSLCPEGGAQSLSPRCGLDFVLCYQSVEGGGWAAVCSLGLGQRKGRSPWEHSLWGKPLSEDVLAAWERLILGQRVSTNNQHQPPAA